MRAESRRSRWQRRLSELADGYRGWLLDHGSLTRSIQQRCPAFGVRRVRQKLAAPLQDELHPLRLRRKSLAMVREVYLLCGDTPVVFAHSVVARRGLRGPWRMLAGLGARPLGAALFADPRVQRHPLRFRKLPRGHPLCALARQGLGRDPGPLWARRSLFVLKGVPLLVTEVFLPGILRLQR